ncbi:MAG: Asp-tRNA(Asn)/Glu-tRNA(Gln) amidotransferase subunit GatC [Magnetococcales bacterium]|nr:Asp-tRNA(Asn)/Glu-tRNA(Gln) amidotransferase subunit GatC [Magnetococcales bacterium]
MSLDVQQVRHVASLARLAITPEEETLYSGQLSRILQLMEELNQLPTDGVPPMSHAVAVRMPERDDVVTNGNNRDALLANAPEAEEGHFRVPKIIE